MFRLARTGVTLTAAALLAAMPALAEKPRYGPPPKTATPTTTTSPAPVERAVVKFQPSPTPLAAEEAKVVVIDESQAREWELQIELDLMSDTVTFPHSLRCLAGQNGMEVRGYVPNALVRDRALSIARKACPMEVVSGMVIQPNMFYGAPGTLTFDAVQARLAKLNTPGLSLVEVQVGLNGQVILSGRASSLDEKLRFSRQLRGLAGCACVRNDMSVPPGTVVVPVITASVPPAIPQPTAPVTAAVSIPTGPTTMPPTIPTSSQTGPPPVSAPPGQLTPASQGNGSRPTAPWSPAPPATKSAFTPGRMGAQATDKPASSDLANPLLPPSRPSAPNKPPSDVARMPPAPVAPSRPADYRPEIGGAVVQTSLVPEGPATPPPPAGTKSAPPAEAKTAVATLPARNQQALTQRLRGTLGAAIRNLELKFDGKGGVRVIVTVAGKNQDLDMVATTIVQAPELKEFDVSLEMRLDP
jgi:hypothetical protein